MASTERADFKRIGKVMLWAADDDPYASIVIDPVTGNILFGGGSAAPAGVLDLQAAGIDPIGSARIDFSNVNIAAANTDGGIMKAGTSAAYVTEDTANMKFMSFYFDNGATSGDSRGLYLRLALTGIGGGGEAARIFTSMTAAGATARGAHISLSFGTAGNVSGLGTALETTLHIRSTATMTGTLSGLKVAINSDAATSDPAGSRLSLINCVSQGDSTGMADVDTDCAFVDFQGFTPGSGKMIYDNQGGAPANTEGSIKIRLPSGAAAYLMYYDSEAA